MERIQMVSLRIVREQTVLYWTRNIDKSRVVYELFRSIAEDLDREAIWVVCLDAKNRLNCLSQVAMGTLHWAPTHPREIFKIALLANAAGVITVHNHPSGDPMPSDQDRFTTSQMQAAANVLGVSFLDHIIIGNGSYYSYADHGGLS